MHGSGWGRDRSRTVESERPQQVLVAKEVARGRDLWVMLKYYSLNVRSGHLGTSEQQIGGEQK